MLGCLAFYSCPFVNGGKEEKKIKFSILHFPANAVLMFQGLAVFELILQIIIHCLGLLGRKSSYTH